MTDTIANTAEQIAYVVMYHDPFLDQFRAVPDEVAGSILTFTDEAVA